MIPFRRRRGPLRAAKKTARRTAPRRLLVRLVFRVARPFAPGMIVGAAGSYFLNRSAGGDRRKKALDLVGGLRGKKTD